MFNCEFMLTDFRESERCFPLRKSSQGSTKAEMSLRANTHFVGGWLLVSNIWPSKCRCFYVTDSHLPGALRLRISKDIDLRLLTLAKTEIVRADCVPAIGPLIEIEPTTDLDDPTIVDADLTVVKVLIDLDIEDDVGFEQALFQLFQLVVQVGQVRAIVVTRD